MTVIEHPSPNHSSRGGVRVDTIVLHHTGPGKDHLAWLCNPESEASAHYYVPKDGRVFRLVDESRKAWHAGVSHLPWEQPTRRGSVNARSIGIELENDGDGKDPFTEEQYAALAWLLPDIVRRLRPTLAPEMCDGVQAIRIAAMVWDGSFKGPFRAVAHGPDGPVYILGHRHVAHPPGRKTDPADTFDWGKVRESLSGGGVA